MSRSQWRRIGMLGLCVVALPLGAQERSAAAAAAVEEELIAAAASHVVSDARVTDPHRQRIIRGSQIIPVPVKLSNDPALKDLIFLGSYIVNAQGGCNDCHTNPPYAPGGDPFQGEPEQINVAGYLAGGQQFGPFTSRDLRPDANGLPAGHTFKEFKQILRTGVDLDNAHPELGPLLQVMPWPVFRKMTDYEIAAIYAYLSAIRAD